MVVRAVIKHVITSSNQVYSHGTTHVASRPSRDCAPTLGYHGIRTRRRESPHSGPTSFSKFSHWRKLPALRLAATADRQPYLLAGRPFGVWRENSILTVFLPVYCGSVTCKRTRVKRPPTARRTSTFMCNNYYYYQYYYYCNNAYTF